MNRNGPTMRKEFAAMIVISTGGSNGGSNGGSIFSFASSWRRRLVGVVLFLLIAVLAKPAMGQTVNPVITSLSPGSAQTGTPGLSINVNGRGFASSSIVRWNGADRLTSFINSNMLSVNITAADLSVAGTASVTVFNPPPQGGPTGSTSNALTFTVLESVPLTPVITSLTPNSANAGDPGFVLTVNGRGFANTTVVRWNGTNRPTVFISGTQLTAQIPAADIASVIPVSVTVSSPPNSLGAGGGTSNALPFTINQPPNPVPAIASIFPSSTLAGSPGFTMTVNGSGFIASSQLRWNGANRPVTFVSSTQLSAQISAADVQSVGSAAITVANPAPGGGVSNSVTFRINPQPLPPPVLQNIASTVVAQGSRQVRLTLIGTNFRPGARVVIGQNATNASLMPATDIIIENLNRISETTIQLMVSVSPQALLETRSVDVVNSDNTSTAARGSNSTKALRVQSGSSLGAPAQVNSLVITYPRTGTIISQGDSAYAEGVLTGAGTGTIIGQWLWDGNVYDQFTLNLTGGERQLLKTSRPLPTVFIGTHTLELKIISPNLIQSPAITVVINPGTWKQMRALSPASGRGFTPEKPPILRWTILPGAAKYQVGFSTQPFFRTVTVWHDVASTSWQVPSQVWSTLPEGEIFWTVRAVEMSGAIRQPALMRRIQRVVSGALSPMTATNNAVTQSIPGQSIPGRGIPTLLLQWKELKAPLANPAKTNPATTLYRVTVTSDKPEGAVIRRFLTTAPQVDLHSIANRLTAGDNYHWQVEAYTASGRLVMAGPGQSFVAPAANKASGISNLENTNWKLMIGLIPPSQPSGGNATAEEQRISRLMTKHYPDLASLHLPQSSESDAEFVNELSEQIVSLVPASGQSVNDARQLIAVELKNKPAMAETSLLVDDTDVTALARIVENKISYKPAIPFGNGSHQVTFGLSGQTAGWNFNVMAAVPAAVDQTAATPGTDAEAEPEANTDVTAATDATADPNAAGEVAPSQLTTEVTSNTQSVSRQEEEKNDISIAAQGSYTNGPWKAEMNANGLINSVFGPNPHHLFGRWNDYIFKFTRDFGLIDQTAVANADAAQAVQQPTGPKWGFDISFGMVAPQMHLNSEYINTGFPREGVEAAMRTPLGKFSYYRNTNDKGQGEGIGFGYRQQVQGASYEIPALSIFTDPERVKFRLMWLSARDIGGIPLKIGFDQNSDPFTTTDAFASPRAGDSFGGLLTIKLNQNWFWNSEYALTSNNINRFSPESSRQFGRAWRTGVNGTWRKANISLSFRDVSPNFAIPATANLSQLSLSDRRGLDFSISRDTRAGNFTGTYQLLQSDFRYAERAHLVLHNAGLNWAKTIGQTTTVALGVSQARTLTTNRGNPALTGEADQSRFGVNASVNQMINTSKLGSINLGLTGARNWFRDRINQNANNIISSVGVNAGWTPKPFFQLQSNFSVNWTAGEKFTVGNSVITTAYIQPVLTWARTGWSVMPLISINQMNSRLGTGERTFNMLMTQTGGRISYQLPGRWRFNTFSFEGTIARTRDGVNRTTLMTPRFLFLWTMIRPSKPPAEPAQASPAQQTTNE